MSLEKNNFENKISISFLYERLKDWILFLIDRKGIILLGTFCFLFFTVSYNYLKSPIYYSRTTFVLDNDSESSMGDYQGIVDGTYLSYDDSDDTVRVQCEEFILVGDNDWASFGNGCHFEVSDINSQISCSAIGGVIVSTLSTGGSIDVAANANGVLQNAASDFTLKENIKPIENPLKKVLDLQGVNFQYKKENDRKKYIGLIAQEVMKIVPEVVFEHDDVFGINYKLLVPLLVEAVKERQKEIENLKERLDKFD